MVYTHHGQEVPEEAREHQIPWHKRLWAAMMLGSKPWSSVSSKARLLAPELTVQPWEQHP